VSDLVLVSRAAAFAARCHTADRKKGGEDAPYVNHLAEVAALLAEATGGGDAALVAAGWLHDAVEDEHATEAELRREFGEDVAALVAAATDPPGLDKAERRRRQVAETPGKSPRAKALKLADKISNTRTRIRSVDRDEGRADLAEYLAFAEAVAAGCRDADTPLLAWWEETAAEAKKVLTS
jgi:(p)ppGpp synthase/HD superfamily hydrolase